jgi:hypothetical protein
MLCPQQFPGREHHFPTRELSSTTFLSPTKLLGPKRTSVSIYPKSLQRPRAPLGPAGRRKRLRRGAGAAVALVWPKAREIRARKGVKGGGAARSAPARGHGPLEALEGPHARVPAPARPLASQGTATSGERLAPPCRSRQAQATSRPGASEGPRGLQLHVPGGRSSGGRGVKNTTAISCQPHTSVRHSRGPRAPRLTSWRVRARTCPLPAR